MLNAKDLALYLCTERYGKDARDFVKDVDAALRGGVSMVQLREKELGTRDFFDLAREMRQLTDRYGVPLVINDRLDIALACGADGLHIGQGDLPVQAVRRVAGKRLFVGVSCGSILEAEAAEAEGADYIGVGPVFQTGSKSDAGAALGTETLARIIRSVAIPTVAIGGITVNDVPCVLRAGAAGIAVISAILQKEDKAGAASELKEKILNVQSTLYNTKDAEAEC
jgi:thiamine-phosphate pyrophosphorylase